MKRKLAILGGGELGRQVAHYSVLNGTYEVIGFLDDTIERGIKVDGKPVLGKINELEKLFSQSVFDEVFIGIGYDHFDFKSFLYERITQQKIPLATIISPQVYIDPTSKIGKGVILYPGSLIEKDAVVEDNAVINVHSTIAHNSFVGKHSFIAGGAVLAGYAKVGASCFIGVNSVINDHISVCDGVTVGSLTVVGKNIKTPGIYFNDNRRLFKY